jgi:hypothetical protein
MSAQPTNGEPGKCYAKCLVPAKFEKTTVPVTIKEASMKVQIKPATFTSGSEQMTVQEASKTYSAFDAKFAKDSKKVRVKDSYKVLKVVPAQFETVTESVLIKDAYKVAKVIPATYKTATFQEMVKAGYTTYEKKPAKFRDEIQTIEISPKSTKWVKTKSGDNCLSVDPEDCMVWCSVEVPAEYKNVTKKVLVGCDAGWEINGDDCVKASKVEPVYKTYTKKVVDAPARVEYVEYPAKYKERTYQKLVSEAKVVEEVVPETFTDWSFEKLASDANATETPIPAKYETRTFQNLGSDASLTKENLPGETINIEKTNLVTPGGFAEEWREVVCDTDVTPRLIALVQRALLDRGYNVGPAGVDNILGTDTKEALKKFQKDKGLPIGNLDFETLKALGIKQ